MAEQLDVFLGAETTQFLLRLFEVIESKEYLTPSNVASAAAALIANLTAVAAAASSSSSSGGSALLTASSSSSNVAVAAAAAADTNAHAFASSNPDAVGSAVVTDKEQTPPIEVSF